MDVQAQYMTDKRYDKRPFSRDNNGSNIEPEA